jgi:hypothetical protein
MEDNMDGDDLFELIFAEIKYTGEYPDEHLAIVDLIESNFADTQSGLQGDSWIWIMDGGERVKIDTFSSMRHQVKSRKDGPHVQKVINVLRAKYEVVALDEPERVW